MDCDYDKRNISVVIFDTEIPQWNICVTNDHELVLFVVIAIRPFPHL